MASPNKIYIVVSAPPITLEVLSVTLNCAFISAVDKDHPIRNITTNAAMPMADFNSDLGLLIELIRGKRIAANAANANKMNAAGIP